MRADQVTVLDLADRHARADPPVDGDDGVLPPAGPVAELAAVVAGCIIHWIDHGATALDNLTSC